VSDTDTYSLLLKLSTLHVVCPARLFQKKNPENHGNYAVEGVITAATDRPQAFPDLPSRKRLSWFFFFYEQSISG